MLLLRDAWELVLLYSRRLTVLHGHLDTGAT